MDRIIMEVPIEIPTTDEIMPDGKIKIHFDTRQLDCTIKFLDCLLKLRV